MPEVSAVPIAVTSDVEAAGGTINARAAQIADELESLKRLLQPLVDTWTGAAATYYQGLQAEWNMAAEGLFGPTGVLGQIANAMNVTWNNYEGCEWSNMQTWKH
jgi:WXG100 family type VII secretion target